MSPAERVAGSLGILLLIALFAALIRRGHWRSLPIFTGYILCMVVTQSAIAADPQRFYRWDFWLFHETAVATLRFGVALELAHRVFRGFPGAAASAWNAMLVVVVVVAVALAGVYSPHASYERIVTEFVPAVAHGTAWVLTALAALVLWYRIPLAPLPKALLVTLTPYLLVFTVTRGLLFQWGWELRQEIGWSGVVAYNLVKGYWTLTAWRSPVAEPARVTMGNVGAAAAPAA